MVLHNIYYFRQYCDIDLMCHRLLLNFDSYSAEQMDNTYYYMIKVDLKKYPKNILKSIQKLIIAKDIDIMLLLLMENEYGDIYIYHNGYFYIEETSTMRYINKELHNTISIPGIIHAVPDIKSLNDVILNGICILSELQYMNIINYLKSNKSLICIQ